MTFAEKLYVPHVDAPAEIKKHPGRTSQARELGGRLVSGSL